MTGQERSAEQRRAAALKAARREIARTHHPDRGGDPDTYIRLLAELDRRQISRPATSAAAVQGMSRRALRRRAWRRTIDAVRRKVRRRLTGSSKPTRR
ncbi:MULTISPECIES: hypothetical protein [Rhodococcus]|uniref:Uncharacterized protein n=1 Tax=Rhodococcoides kyotonense TaxID=398843 RepID=A0A177YIA9_9NOCA|nr:MULTISPECIES: hypothetical protein [Rhodococcus]OAK54828.1 hypothetical protein A3K89_05815 [Rhodococcus kyotonensis]